MAFYSIIKRNILTKAATKMDLKDMLSKRIQTPKNTYCMILFI